MNALAFPFNCRPARGLATLGLGALLLAGCHSGSGSATPPTGGASGPTAGGTVPADPPEFTRVFSHHTATVNGVKLHYVLGGQGPVVVLLHGWPETWHAWAKVMPLLAPTHTVLALDLPGLGDSDPPPNDAYDERTIATLLHGLLGQLGYQKINLVGHDLGLWMAYAYAAQYGPEVEHLVLLDANLPGIASPAPLTKYANNKSWQFAFNSIDDLPELLASGKVKPYLSWFYANKAVHRDSVAPDIPGYVAAYTPPARLHAGFEYYRAAFARPVNDAAENKAFAQHPLAMPVLAYGGADTTRAMGPGLLPVVKRLATNVQGGVIPDCGHYIEEEQPHYLVQQLLTFFAGGKPRSD